MLQSSCLICNTLSKCKPGRQQQQIPSNNFGCKSNFDEKLSEKNTLKWASENRTKKQATWKRNGEELLLLVAFKFFKFKLCFLLTFLALQMS